MQFNDILLVPKEILLQQINVGFCLCIVINAYVGHSTIVERHMNCLDCLERGVGTARQQSFDDRSE